MSDRTAVGCGVKPQIEKVIKDTQRHRIGDNDAIAARDGFDFDRIKGGGNSQVFGGEVDVFPNLALVFVFDRSKPCFLPHLVLQLVIIEINGDEPGANVNE